MIMMTTREAIQKATETMDPAELVTIYEKFEDNASVVKAIVNRDTCPDELKKRYVLYALNHRLRMQADQLGPSGHDILDSIVKSLEAWQPIQKLSKLPRWDTEDSDATAIAEVLEKHKREVILYGPPGTSKTRLARMLAARLAENDQERIKFVQFHPSYGYEDFIEGIVPCEVNGRVSFKIQDKVFKEFCAKARRSLAQRFVLLIDEINRADLSKVMGELFTCLEYRGESVQLLYSGRSFQIPRNMYILGTMNTLDRSTFDIDYALRRRFYFYEVPPSEERLRNILSANNVEIELRERCIAAFNGTRKQGYELGHAYFKDVKRAEDVRTLWLHQLKPLLEQYFSTERTKVSGAERLFQEAWAATTLPMP